MTAILAGWKTRIFSLLLFVYGLVELIDPDVLTTALGLGNRGHAVSVIVIAVATYILRELTKGPAGSGK